jgi:hypothetical protein
LIYWLEFAGIYAFAAYWSVKSYEMSLSKLEKRAIKEQIRPGIPPGEET